MRVIPLQQFSQGVVDDVALVPEAAGLDELIQAVEMLLVDGHADLGFHT